MSFFDAISVAASGLTAERVRMDVTSENLANADTTQGADGQPYQEQEVYSSRSAATASATRCPARWAAAPAATRSRRAASR